MPDPNFKKRFFIIFFILFIISFLIKYQGPGVIKGLYENGAFSILNQLTGAQGKQSLDFYLGKADDVLLGPVFSVITGAMLLSFCFFFLEKARPVDFGLAIFVYLIVTRLEVLFYPPYGELVATGAFAPAVWLKRHSFDYIGLLHQESFVRGGPRTFYTSIYPTFVAILMAITPTAKAFLFVIHTIIFGLFATMTSVFREMMKKFFDPQTALISAVLLVSLPLSQSMSEQLSMAVPNAFFVVLSAHYLLKRDIPKASLMAVLALLVKAPGGIACVMVLGVSTILFFVDPKFKKKPTVLLWGAGAVVLAVMKFVARSLLIGDQPTHNRIGFLLGWPYMKNMAVLWLFAAALVVLMVYVMKWCQKEKATLRRFLREYLDVLIMFDLAALWFVLYLNFSVMGYRYEVMLAPFFIFALMYVTRPVFRNKKAFQWTLVGITLFSFFCAYGLLYDRNIESSIYSSHDFERSLEYRNDQKLHMRLAREIEERVPDFLIAAPHVVAQKLALPELGYVDKSLSVMIYGMPCTYGGIKQFRGLRDIDIRKTMWVGFYKSHLPEELDYPMGPRDRLVKDIEVGDKKVALFMGGFAIERIRRIIELSVRGQR